MRKNLEAHVLPVRLVPYRLDKHTQCWTPALPNPGTLDIGCGVDIEYNLRVLTLDRKQDREKVQAEQWRAATVAAMSLLIYIVLFELVRKAQSARPRLSMTLVRLQKTGRIKGDREADAQEDGNTTIYAISQAVEKALARELPSQTSGTHDRKRST
ncbi:MAG: hypothetical protein MZV65_50445 [Chromatiales bacterium]|nr:hypothetical protein [Chromatiales bacterium]